MGLNRKDRLPTVRRLDAEDDIFGKQDNYGVEMLRRLLLEIRRSSPLLRSLYDEVLKRRDDVELRWLGPWLEPYGIPQDSGLGTALRDTVLHWLKYPHEVNRQSPLPFIPTGFPLWEEITLAVGFDGWDRTRETWDKFEARFRREAKTKISDFLKRYKAEVMQKTERVRRYDTESIRWLVWKMWGFNDQGRPWSWHAIAVNVDRSVPTVKRAVKLLVDKYGIKLVTRSTGGRPPG
jgi:hypothetical protein